MCFTILQSAVSCRARSQEPSCSQSRGASFISRQWVDLVGQLDREKEWVAGIARAVGGTDFPAVSPQALPPCQRLSRLAWTQPHTQRQDKTADRKWIEMDLFKWGVVAAEETHSSKFLVGWSSAHCTTGMYSGIRHKPAGGQCLNTSTNPYSCLVFPFIFPHHLTNPRRLPVCGEPFY